MEFEFFLGPLKLENAEIEDNGESISSWELYFSLQWRPGLEATGRGTAPSQGAGSPAPASASSQAGGVGSSSAGRSPFSPAAGAGAAGAGAGTCCVVELISFADSPPAGLVRTKPR